jgi:hypothetical protein
MAADQTIGPRINANKRESKQHEEKAEKMCAKEQEIQD